MGHFLEANDLRRPNEVPRLAERKAAHGEAIWMPPSRRRMFRGTPTAVKANIVDLSVGGALVTSHVNPNIKVGSKVRFSINGGEGVVEVRSIRPGTDRIAYYGVSFFRMSDQLRAEVFRMLAVR